jgi:hypothetical protein
MGYHTKEIPKGELGEFSKIREEYEELRDAESQECKVLAICELTDLIGAIEAYAQTQFNLSLKDLIQFSNMTKSAFLEGKRK